MIWQLLPSFLDVQKDDILFPATARLVEYFVSAPKGNSNVYVSSSNVVFTHLWLLISFHWATMSFMKNFQNSPPNVSEYLVHFYVACNFDPFLLNVNTAFL